MASGDCETTLGAEDMRILGLDHVQLAMPAGGEPEARAFYHGVLGIPEVQKPPNLAKRGGCWFEFGTVKIHLGVDAEFRAARKAHPALLVEGLADLKSAIEAAGFPVRTDEPLPGYDRIYVDDPFGNRIELLEPLRT
jgi:catechol 2,3-dioxygenase-like lactoylglutathione lyase family enzyme